MTRAFIALGLALTVLIGCGDPEQQHQPAEQKKKGPTVEVFGPGQMPDSTAKTVGDILRLEEIYQESLTLVNDWLPGRRERGLALLREAAEAGYVPAMTDLAIQIFEAPDNLGESVEASIGLLRKASTFREPRAMLILGDLLREEGQKAEGQALIDRALATKDPVVFSEYGARLLDRGKTEAEKREGLAFIQKGADAGVPQALVNLAKLYAAGMLVEKDQSKALNYFRAAVENGGTEGAWRFASIAIDQTDDRALRQEAWTLLARGLGYKSGMGAMAYGTFLMDQNLNPKPGGQTCKDLQGLGAAWVHLGLAIAERAGRDTSQIKKVFNLALSQLPVEQREIYEAQHIKQIPDLVSDDFIAIDCGVAWGAKK